MKERDVKVAHCIQSDMKLARSITPAVEMLRHNITLSIGTDCNNSSNNFDMFSEMNNVAKIHKVANMDSTVMSAEKTFHASTLGGAKALGADLLTGSLEVGKKAEFIVIDLDQPHMVPLYNIPSHLTYVAKGGDVIHSFVNGKLLMRNRQLLTLDEDKLLNHMKKITHRKKMLNFCIMK